MLTTRVPAIREKLAALQQCVQRQQDALNRGDLDELARAVDDFDKLSSAIGDLTQNISEADPSQLRQLGELLAGITAAQQRLLLDVRLRHQELGDELRALEKRLQAINNYAPNVVSSGGREDG